MGKATGIGSQFRGKVGNVIGYLSKNRAGRYEQTVKGYQPVVANPQTYAQALARVPVGPVQRVCSALLTIVQRGFEGIAYGDPSKNEFLSYNLKNFRGPFMVKGAVAVPPGPMLISKGSLSPITVREFPDGAYATEVVFHLGCSLNRATPTKGELSANLLRNGTALVPGEQLTFVTVRLLNDQYHYDFESVILDINDTSYPQGILSWVSNDGGYMMISPELSGLDGLVCAAACIRSQAWGATSFRRSTAFLECNPGVYLYNDQSAVQEAVASYRTGDVPEDWEDDPTPEYQQLAYLCMVDITTNMIISQSSPSPIGHQCLGYVTKGGEMGIFFTYSNQFNSYVLIDGKANVITITVGTQEKAFIYNASFQPARQYSSIYGTM